MNEGTAKAAAIAKVPDYKARLQMSMFSFAKNRIVSPALPLTNNV